MVRRSPKFNFLQRRHLSISDPFEETVPWDTSWLESDTQEQSHAVTPKTGDVALISTPDASADRGVSIDKRGQLKITSPLRAKIKCRTALILSATSTNLTKADITRVMPEIDRIRGSSIEGPVAWS